MSAGGNHPRAPRNSLTDQRILLEALALVDETGLEGLTTRALGHRLGVDSTAVYRHFRSRNELLSALADHIMGNASQPPPGNNGDGSLRGQLRGACLCLRRALLAHPAMTAIVVRRPPRGTGTWAATEHAVGLLRQAGLSDQDAARAYQALLSYTLGHAMLEAPYAAPDAEQRSCLGERCHTSFLARLEEISSNSSVPLAMVQRVATTKPEGGDMGHPNEDLIRQGYDPFS